MPRKSKLLPYLQLHSAGRLSYVCHVPPKVRPFVGNRSIILRSLGVTSTNFSSSAVLKAWTAVNTEFEALVAEAKAEQAGKSLVKAEKTSLSPRDAEAIAAEPWRRLP